MHSVSIGDTRLVRGEMDEMEHLAVDNQKKIARSLQQFHGNGYELYHKDFKGYLTLKLINCSTISNVG